MKRGLLLIVTLFFVLSIAFAAASFSYKNNKLQTNYFGGENIAGTINITFSNHDANSMFTSNMAGNITLKELLERNNFSAGSYNCSSTNCLPDYAAPDSITTLNLQSGSPKVVGFKITTDDIESISSLKFKIASTIGSVCYDQLLIDVLDKNEKFIQNPTYSSESCDSKSTGCFDTNLSSSAYLNPIIGNNRYCEKITLPRSPGYEIGAKVTKISGIAADNELKMEIFSLSGDYIGECFLPKITQNVQEAGCIINYSNVQQKESLVCISSESSDEKYTIKAEQGGSRCGTSNKDSNVYNVDYDLYAKGLQFSSSSLEVNPQNYEINNNEESLTDYISDYVYNKYEGSCPSNGCIIPFKISGPSQTLTFSNIELKYSSSIGTISNDNLYLIQKSDSKITSKSLSLDISPANFVIPVSSPPSSFKLYLGGENVLSQNINVTSSFDFSISPRTVLLGLDTSFFAITSQNITSSKWDFGNGDIKNASGKSVVYRYMTSGEHTIGVTLSSVNGKTSKKSFTVSVGNATESANQLIKLYESRIANLTKTIISYPTWISDEIKKKYDPIDYNASLGRIKNDVAVATEDQDYIDAVGKLLELNVPSDIYVSKSGDLPIIYGSENINTEYIKELSGQSENSATDEKIIKDINSWVINNYDANINFQVISKTDGLNKEDILTKIKITLTPKGENVADSFLIINYPLEAIKFSSAENAKTVGSGTYITVSGSKEVEFLIPATVKIEELGIYLSPEISKLGGVYEDIPFVEKPVFKTLWFIILIVILILATLIGYIVLQEWYKKNYEKHLFKNKDDLFNIINFVYNSRSSELKDSEIRKNLLKARWSGEQINYAFKKIDGKRTGMWEIPLFKGKENREVHEEIAKRHGGSVDTRFIKRPEF